MPSQTNLSAGTSRICLALLLTLQSSLLFAQQVPIVDAPVPPGTFQTPGSAGVPASDPTQSAEELPLPAPDDPAAAAMPLTVESGELVVRIRDVISVDGHRSNSIFGRGLVTGLNGTGGRSPDTQRMAANLAGNLGNNPVPPFNNTRSASVVMVNGYLPPFVKRGEEITVTVSVMDDASNLRGGILQDTPLLGADGEVYAIASGPILNHGFGVGGDAGSVTKNHPTTGTCRAIVEKEVCFDSVLNSSHIKLNLRNKDYVTATRIASAVNELFPRHARPIDMGTVEILVPKTFKDAQTEFISTITSLSVVPNMPARVVINQKNGTIVIGSNVRISRVIFANDNLIVTTNENPVVSQPAPLSGGTTEVVPRTQITAIEQGGKYNMLKESISVGEFAAALNALGVPPQDLISIFQTLEASGALHAELIIE
ncbi:MAG: flagellar basal body P-ring protein FlgI [Planctomycetota bacterium]